MKYLYTLLCLTFFTATTQAQEEAPKYGWKTQMVFSLGLTQASFSNWTKGGENSLAWQTTLNSRFTKDEANHNWDNKAKFTFGQSKVGDTGTRKTADEVKLETIFTLKRNLHLNPFVSATALTQFTSGYDYSGTTKTKVSQLLDPGDFTQSAGIGYSRSDEFKARLGATIKETYTRSFPGYADDPDTPAIEKTRIEGGITGVAELNRKVSENITYTSELVVFSNVKAFNEIDVNWENLFSAKVAKYINVTLAVDLVYDRDTINEWQFREVLSAGFTYNLF
ncbi:MAG: DUF3078 domain-containing protein [Candidatus Latescibacteria bacterium]|nr:DUF3078 domain-containing protein [Candidatus Latescibacterota bacterium]